MAQSYPLAWEKSRKKAPGCRKQGIDPVHETAKRLVVLWDPTAGASHELTAHRRRCHRLPRDFGAGILGPGLSQRVPAQAANSPGRVPLSPRPLRRRGRVLPQDEGHHRAVLAEHRQVRAGASRPGDQLREGPTEGRPGGEVSDHILGNRRRGRRRGRSGTVSDFVLGSYVLSSKPKTKSDAAQYGRADPGGRLGPHGPRRSPPRPPAVTWVAARRRPEPAASTHAGPEGKSQVAHPPDRDANAGTPGGDLGSAQSARTPSAVGGPQRRFRPLLSARVEQPQPDGDGISGLDSRP